MLDFTLQLEFEHARLWQGDLSYPPSLVFAFFKLSDRPTHYKNRQLKHRVSIKT
jgi:hypothetical protein